MADLSELSGILYLSTISNSNAESALDQALASLLNATAPEAGAETSPRILYRLYYEQAQGPSSTSVDGDIINMSSSSIELAFDDGTLQSVRDAWNALRVDEEEAEYMKFEDREGQDDEDVYE